MNAMPAPEPSTPEPPTPDIGPRTPRDSGPHITLTFYCGEGLTAHGPYPGLEAADQAAGRIMHADHTAFTYALALAAPGNDPVTTQHTTEMNGHWCSHPTLWVTRRLATKIRTYVPPTEYDGPAVALIQRTAWTYAVLTGPFTSTHEAADWSTRRPARTSHLRRIGASITVLPLYPDHLGSPAPKH